MQVTACALEKTHLTWFPLMRFSLMLFFLFYSVSGFVDKNRDSQQDVFFDLLGKSKSPFVQQLVEYRDLLSQLSKFGQLGADPG